MMRVFISGFGFYLFCLGVLFVTEKERRPGKVKKIDKRTVDKLGKVRVKAAERDLIDFGEVEVIVSYRLN